MGQRLHECNWVKRAVCYDVRFRIYASVASLRAMWHLTPLVTRSLIHVYIKEATLRVASILELVSLLPLTLDSYRLETRDPIYRTL
jgi:hypothetical protein